MRKTSWSGSLGVFFLQLKSRVSGSGISAGLLLLALTVVTYLPTTQSQFIWDDDFHVENNETLRSLDGLRRIWLELGATPQYYPMVHTSYWLEYRIWELDPTGYHVINILLHGLAAVLFWRVLKALSIPAAWVAAAIFALHPVHVESVAWITERKNVLSGVLYLGSALAYLRYGLDLEHGRNRPRGLYAASLILFLFALFSKTVTCSLPAALLLVFWWKRGRISWADARGLIPFFAAGIALALLTIWVETNLVGTRGEEWQLSIVDRCLLAGRALCFYAFKLFYPATLMFVYPRWSIDAHDWQQYLFPATVMVCMLVLWLARSRVGRGPLVAVLFFAGTLVPALGFFNVYPFRYSFVADHFQYLASLGLITLAVTAAQRASLRYGIWGKRTAVLTAALILVLLGSLSWQHQRHFSDPETLWRSTLKRNPGAWIAHNNLAHILLDRLEYEQALEHYFKALETKPDATEAHHNIAVVFQRLGRRSDAIKHFRLELSFYTPESNSVSVASAHNDLGFALRQQGLLNEAIRHYRLALMLEPEFASAHDHLGTDLYAQGKFGEATVHYRRAVAIEPESPRIHNNLGAALYVLGIVDEAITHYRRALELEPNYADARRNLQQALATRAR